MPEEIAKMLKILTDNNIIEVSDIPNIDLYIDQLVTFIDDNLYFNKDNHLTKAMVNNYCKNKVIPSAEKKRYTKNHILLLIIIYNTKSIISISDIKDIFSSVENEDVELYYNSTIDFIKTYNKEFTKSTMETFEYISSTFDDKDEDKLKIALLATKLAIEANYKKMLSEMLIEKYLR